MDESDLRYLWAAYKRGALAAIALPDDLSPEDFSRVIDEKLSAHCHIAWTAVVDDKPAGFVFAAWSPFNMFLEIVLVAFMPWVSRRVIVETTMQFLNEMREEYRFMGYALREHKRLYEAAAALGLVRRIGTSFNAIPGEQVAIFESRRKD